ncbi:MAG: DNA polymerase III subunit delta [Nocardioidaceae bacterium]
MASRTVSTGASLASRSGAELLGKVVLVTGPEEFLRERELVAARMAVLATDPEAEVSMTTGDTLSGGELEHLSAPSLFSSTRFVGVTRLEDTPETAFEALLGFAQQPPEDVALVLVHSGGPKGSGLLAKLRKAAGLEEVKVPKLTTRDYPAFVASEARANKGAIDAEAATQLVDAVGQDLRALAAGVSQLIGDFPGERITPEIIGRYFSGRAEVKGYLVAEHAIEGRTAQALETLRWAVDTGAVGVMITGSFASSLRGLARVKAGINDGVPDWKLRTVRTQARAWTDGGLARAIQAVASTDADLKGAGTDPDYALERLVMTVCKLRGG